MKRKRHILLAVTGLNPQVITETLYALYLNSIWVDEIHIITTRRGKEKIHADLLADGTGQFYKFLEEYEIDPKGILFNRDTIYVIRDENGVEISDISTEADNESLLRLCLEVTFHLTSSPSNRIFFSVAGGRKTMSSCLTFAAQMYGRPCDRIYHVLVSPEFESNRDFFFPPKISRTIRLIDEKGQPYFKETRYAQVNLIHIPFVSLRDRISENNLKNPQDPASLMLSVVREEKELLVVNIAEKKLIYKTIELDLMPAWMALYAFFIEIKKACNKERQNCINCTECYLDIQSIFKMQDQIKRIYNSITKPDTRLSDTGILNLNSENFNVYKSKIKKAILSRFGPYALRDLEISSIGKRPNTRYGIRFSKEKIQLI